MNHLTTITTQLPAAFLPIAQRAADYAANARAKNTTRAYNIAWRDFSDWCIANGLSPLPAEPGTVVLYLTAHDYLMVSTLQIRKVAIRQAHLSNNYPDPTDHRAVRDTWKGMRRMKKVAQKGKAPLLTEDIRTMLDKCGTDVRGIRDKALLLMCFSGAFRRSEVVALDVGDIQFMAGGMVVDIRSSKGDQEGEGQVVHIGKGTYPETCPVAALQKWLSVSDITEGAIFRRITYALGNRLSDKAVARTIKKFAKKVGLDERQFSGHSTRSGCITSVLMTGGDIFLAQAQARHADLSTTRKYDKRVQVLKKNLTTAVGL